VIKELVTLFLIITIQYKTFGNNVFGEDKFSLLSDSIKWSALVIKISFKSKVIVISFCST